jgi:hypothetical protein
MKTRDRPNFSKKLVKTTTISVALFVAAILIFSSIPTVATPGNTTKMNKIETETGIEEGHSTGLPPQTREIPEMGPAKTAMAKLPASREDCWPMYMEHAVGGGGAERFSVDTCYPDEILEDLGDSEAGDFLSGGTYGCDYLWYGVEYATGVLWAQDIDTYDMWSVGGGGENLNALSWAPLANRMYGVGSIGLTDTIYEINPETGEQTELFELDYSGGLMIGIAFDANDVLYGWDLVDDALWTIDLDTEDIVEIGSLGINLNFAQDGDFHREEDQLYLTAYVGGGYLYKCDKETGDCELVDNLPNNWECTASCFENTCIPPEHDVGVKAILKPTESGHAIPEMEMELLVKNYGQNPETFDAQMEIIKCESSGDYLLEEYFDGGVLPEGWDTDFWQVQNTNYASGDAPEAAVYKYWQSGGGQWYDNYIQTVGFDATGWEKILMNFRWASDLYYPQYCNFFVKYQKNETSPWKDVTPWDNPLGEEAEGDLYIIDCYGFGESLGENFSIKFGYQGYYYYYNWFYLDSITVEGCGGCAEYAELEEDLTLDPGQEMTVVFPGWPPSEWQNESYKDTWEKYPVHGFIILEGDQWPRNDNKWILLELYYPWFWDIEVTEIGSPQEARSIPAQTFDVEATITNVGQFPACCIGIDIAIGAPTVLDTLFTEYNWPTTGWPYYYIYGPGYGSGWRDEHKSIAYYYGWEYRNGNQAGGDLPETWIRYYRCRADYVFSSRTFDTSEYANLRMNFLLYVNHFYGSGLYTIEAGYSHDGGETWIAGWVEAPSGSGSYEVSVPIEGGSATTQIGIWVKGNPYYFNYLYMDNVEVVAMGLEEEYDDFMCQGDDLEPGQSRVFNFEQWTPDFLQYEETAWGVPYTAEAKINVEVDEDRGNDIKVNEFKLDYWHDPAIEGAAASPWLWNNGDADGRNGVAGSMYYGYSNMIIDDFSSATPWKVTGGQLRFCWNSGYGPGNMETVRIEFFQNEEEGECEPSEDEAFVREATAFTEWATGDVYFGRPEIVCDFEMDEVELPPGDWWVGIQPDGIAENIAYILTSESKGCECHAELEYWGYSKWRSSSQLWGAEYDVSYKLMGEALGPPGITEYIKPSTQSVGAVAVNLGTFQELGLRCDAEIWEFISDPLNGSKQYEDNKTGIDLTDPLGGTVPLGFKDFTYAYEGRYGVYFNMPGLEGRDDFPMNNFLALGIGVDNTNPVTERALNPENPDGENGWYVSDLEVTLTASDPLVEDVSSGVKEINYKVGTGSWQTIDGASGTFTITQADDGNDVPVEYYAVDNVGNEEAHHTFTVDMDQTVPTIDLQYEVGEGNPIEGWLMIFTATCSDDTSGMDRVEFFLNDGHQLTVTGSGPTYQWSFVYHGGLNIDIRADAYDIAGNMNSDIVEDPVPTNYNYNNQASQQQTVKILQG